MPIMAIKKTPNMAIQETPKLWLSKKLRNSDRGEVTN